MESETDTDLIELPAGTQGQRGPTARVVRDGTRALKVFDTGHEPVRDGVDVDHRRVAGWKRIGRDPDGHVVVESAFRDAGSLATLVESESKRSWHEALGLGIRLAGALEATHRSGIVHGAVKPTNVLYEETPGGDVVLADAAHGSWAAAADGAATDAIGYYAPEILEGTEPTVATDVYALGATLHYAMAGAVPFQPSSDEPLLRVMRRILTEDPTDLRALRVPDGFAVAVEKAMSKDPGARFAGALEFGRALQEVEKAQGHTPATLLDLGASGEDTGDDGETDVTAPVLGDTPVVRKRSNALSWVFGTAAVILVAAVAVVVGSAVRSANSPTESATATWAPPTSAATPTSTVPPTTPANGEGDLDTGTDASIAPDIAGFHLIDYGSDSVVDNADLQDAMFQSSHVAGIRKDGPAGPEVGVLLSLVLQPELENDPKALPAVLAAIAPDAADAETVEIAETPLVVVTTPDNQVVFAWQDPTGLVANVLRGPERGALEAFLSAPGVLTPL